MAKKKLIRKSTHKSTAGRGKKVTKKAKRPRTKKSQANVPVASVILQAGEGQLSMGQLALVRKLRKISEENPEMETVPLLTRKHKFTKAEDVFKKYHASCRAYDVRIIPVGAESSKLETRYEGIFTYWVVDEDNGAYFVGQIMGGAPLNFGFGSAAAATIGLKQFELQLFMAYWSNDLETALMCVQDEVKQKGGNVTESDALTSFFSSSECRRMKEL